MRNEQLADCAALAKVLSDWYDDASEEFYLCQAMLRTEESDDE